LMKGVALAKIEVTKPKKEEKKKKEYTLKNLQSRKVEDSIEADKKRKKTFQEPKTSPGEGKKQPSGKEYMGRNIVMIEPISILAKKKKRRGRYTRPK